MIRAATIEDLPALAALGREMHAESTYRDLPYDGDKVQQVLGELIKRGGDCLLVVAERDGEIIGGLAVIITEYWFCRQRGAQDLALFVRPDQRGGMAAVRMIDAARDWALARGCAEVRLGITTGVHEARTGDLYRRMMFEPAGSLWKWRCR